MITNLRTIIERYMPYMITKCCLPPNTDEQASLNRSQADWTSTQREMKGWIIELGDGYT